MNLTINILLSFFKTLEKINTFFLRIGRQFAWIAILLMVIVILVQVFFRYVLNNALPWPDEVARFLMLWMTGLIAPSAYRWGGFVSIDLLERFLPKLISTLLALFSIFILGGEILRGFSFAMIMGVLIGTYSSIFVASPILKFFKVSYKTLEKEEEKIVP